MATPSLVEFQQQTTAPSRLHVFQQHPYGLDIASYFPEHRRFRFARLPRSARSLSVAGSGSDSASSFADTENGGADFAISGSDNAQQSGIFSAALTGLDPGSPATPGSFTLYVVDGTRAVLIETDPAALTRG